MNNKVNIKKIRFNDNTEIGFNNDDIVLFVGANNVGKSRTIKDIKYDMDEDTINKKIIVKDIEYDVNLDNDFLYDYFTKHFPTDGHDNFIVNNSLGTFYFHKQEILKKPLNSKYFLKLFYTFLSTGNRLNLSEDISYQRQVDNSNLNILNKLDTSDEMLNKVNKYLLDSFNTGVCVYDDHYTQNVRRMYKIGTSEEINEILESKKNDSIEKSKKLLKLCEQGDGIRSAFATLSSLIVSDCFLFLIDEPETFLHPPQAKVLGNNIVEISKGKQCFISTHSIDFIKGILEKDASRVKIVKIDRDGDINHINLLGNDDISKISNDRNLRHTNILNGLFYNQVLLCEDESDCKFYSSILEHLNTEVYQNTLFCATGGKDKFKLLVPLLKSLGIKYKIITDLDFINDNGKFSDLVKIIDGECDSIVEKHRAFIKIYQESANPTIENKKEVCLKIKELLEKDKGELYLEKETIDYIGATLNKATVLGGLKKYGAKSIPSKCYELYEEINNYLTLINIFPLKCGEIEGLIPGIFGHGIKWVESAFEKYPDFDDKVYNEAKDFLKQVFNIVE